MGIAWIYKRACLTNVIDDGRGSKLDQWAEKHEQAAVLQ